MAIQIKISYDDMGKYAQIMNTEAADVQKCYNSLNSQADQLKGSTFVGQTANAWHQEIERDILPKLKHLHQVLIGLAQLVGWLNQNYEQADGEWTASFAGIEISVNV
jgi:WXG100 family type VII secretion target